MVDAWLVVMLDGEYGVRKSSCSFLEMCKGFRGWCGVVSIWCLLEFDDGEGKGNE